MGQQRPSVSGARNGRVLRNVLDEWVTELVIVLVGVSQVVLSLSVFVSGRGRIGFVLASGGWLLVGIGTNLLRDRGPFDSSPRKRTRESSPVSCSCFWPGASSTRQ
jgi:hypothetical protein